MNTPIQTSKAIIAHTTNNAKTENPKTSLIFPIRNTNAREVPRAKKYSETFSFNFSKLNIAMNIINTPIMIALFKSLRYLSFIINYNSALIPSSKAVALADAFSAVSAKHNT